MPAVITKGEGVHVWDVEGNKYIDCLSGISSVNQGHCHPKIYEEMCRQAKKLTMTSRAFHNDQLGPFEEYLAKLLKYDKVLLMNTGVEACESAVKICRRWGYVKKNIPDNEATIIFATHNYHGRTIATCAASDTQLYREKLGPFDGLKFEIVAWDDANALEQKFKSNKNIAAYVVEPIQGEAGVVIPSKGYFKKVRELCDKYKVLLVADEIQAGLGRAGKMLSIEWEGVRPDVVTLAKSLSGGFYPISAVLADNDVMLTINPGEHGSTFGGNPMAAAIGMKSMEVLIEEGMIENSARLGPVLLNGIKGIKKDFLKESRGRGLFMGIDVEESDKVKARDFCLRLMKEGVLTNVTKKNIIRMAPPLMIKESQVEQIVKAFKKVADSY